MPTALFIDGVRTSVSLLAHTMQRMGFNVLSTVGIYGASWYCQQFKVDVIVVDILPGSVPAEEVARTLRQSCDELPVLFILGTPLEAPDSETAGMEALLPGRVECLTKPFTAEALGHAVSKLLRRAHPGLETRSAVGEAKGA